jgi:putative redox protein
MRSRKVNFPSADGLKLVGNLDLPDAEAPRAYALFAHCFTCSKNIRAAAYISRALASEGIGVLRFDFTGLGESEGEFAETNFSSNLADLVSAAQFMGQAYEPPRLLVGHSLGGAAVIQAAARIRSSAAVVTIAAPAEPIHVSAHLGRKREQIEREGEAEVELAGRRFTIRRHFLEDLRTSSAAEAIRELDRALLIFHSPRDGTVDIDNAGEIFAAARHPKSFISLDTADHLLSNPADAEYVGSVIAAWAHRYLA